MSERMTPERLAEIRAWAAEWKDKGIGAHTANALLQHLDAVERERDACHRSREVYKTVIRRLEKQRDELGQVIRSNQIGERDGEFTAVANTSAAPGGEGR